MGNYTGTSASEIIDPVDSGNDYIDGLAGNDNLYGWNGSDTLLGYDGDDILYGENGNDVLYGEYGYDTLSGGAGADTFVLGDSVEVYDQGASYDVITDFNYVEGDKFEIMGSNSNYSLDYYGSSTEIYYGSDLIAVVENTSEVLLSGDFITV